MRSGNIRSLVVYKIKFEMKVFEKVFLLMSLAVIGLSCQTKQTAEEKTKDSLAKCIADGMPTRASAILASQENIVEGKGSKAWNGID